MLCIRSRLLLAVVAFVFCSHVLSFEFVFPDSDMECFDNVQPLLQRNFQSTITCNLQRIHLTPLAMNALWWSLTWCILLRIGGMSLPPLLSRWQQLSLSILDELHQANLMFNIKWNKVIRVSEDVSSSDIFLNVVLDVAYSCLCFDIGRSSRGNMGKTIAWIGFS